MSELFAHLVLAYSGVAGLENNYLRGSCLDNREVRCTSLVDFFSNDVALTLGTPSQVVHQPQRLVMRLLICDTIRLE